MARAVAFACASVTLAASIVTPVRAATPAGTAPSTGAVPGGTVRGLVVAGVGGVPTDAAAVVLNVTATGATADGYLTVYPCGRPRPTASNLNYAAGGTVANLVVARLGDGGRVCIYAHATVDVVADVAGWFVGDPGLVPLPSPVRLVDTRTGFGPVEAATTLLFGVGGLAGLPTAAGAVVLNVTAAEPTTDGYLTVWPCDQPRPTASNLNFAAGSTVANLVLTRLAGDGRVCAYAHGTTHVVVDAAGWLPPGGGFTPVTGEPRLLDTRTSTGRFQTAETRFLRVHDPASPGAAPDAVVLNVTATDALDAGYLTVWPCDRPRPLASNVNYVPGGTVPNLVVSRVAADGTVCVYAHAATHVVVDAVGAFRGSGFGAAPAPTRILDTRADAPA